MSPKTLHLRSGTAILLYAAVVVALVQAPAFSMYDPHHGRWFQRDPLGVRPDGPTGILRSTKQYENGPDLYEYVNSKPAVRLDPHGLWGRDLHYTDTLSALMIAHMKKECAEIIAAADQALDDDLGTAPSLHHQYHYDSEYVRFPKKKGENRVPIEHGRTYWSNEWEKQARGIFKKARLGCCGEIKPGLILMGKSLHGKQDALAHSKEHNAETEFDHIPSVYCLLWGDGFGLLIPECIAARENNPNWGNPYRPDDRYIWHDDSLVAGWDIPRQVATDLLGIPSVSCCCRQSDR